MSSSSVSCRRHRTPSLQTTIALVAAMAIAVAVRSTTAVPLSDIDIVQEQSYNTDTTTIKVPNCECVPFHLCYAENAIDVPIGWCKDESVCCQLKIQDPSTSAPSCGTSDLSLSGIANLRILETAATSTSTYLGQFPWMTAILKKEQNYFICGGSLIHPRVILTAAHCVIGNDVNLMKVRVGVWDSTQKSQERGIKKIVYHANYDNGTQFNDVALIELESNIDINQHVNVICIPADEENINYNSQACVSTGWGKDTFGNNGSYQTELKKIDLSIMPNDKCQELLRKTRLSEYFQLHKSFVCAGGQEGQDTCTGDGGGPLICEMSELLSDRKQYIQLGVVSWGIGCGTKDVPGVYSSTRVNSKWIQEKLNNITMETVTHKDILRTHAVNKS